LIWAFIPAPIKRFMAWALAGLVALCGVVVAIKRGERARAENKGLREYQATRKAMDDVEAGNDDPAVLREWLRERGKLGGDL
jgi:hypothetical protein